MITGEIDRASACELGKEVTMNKGPAYRTVDGGAIGLDLIALRHFGGELEDPIAAWVLVSGDPVLQVVAPSTRESWDQATEDRFREEVRELAATHRLLDREGTVSVLFDPPQTSLIALKDIPEGEPIERRS
jgi:hypothetical protein